MEINLNSPGKTMYPKHHFQNHSEFESGWNAAGMAVHILDTEGIVYFANNFALLQLGLKPEEYIGQKFCRFFIDESKCELILKSFESAKPVRELEMIYYKPDGTEKPLSIFSGPSIAIGGKDYNLIFSIDISDKISMLKAYRRIESAYFKDINKCLDAVYTCDIDGNINYYNKSASYLFGYSPDISKEKVKYHAFSKIWIDGKPVELASKPFITVLKYGEAIELNATIERADGIHFQVSMKINPLIDAEGNITGLVNFIEELRPFGQHEDRINYDLHFFKLIQNLPAPFYFIDRNGSLVYYNRSASAIWGTEPELGKVKWCGAWKLAELNGDIIPKEKAPLAQALQEGITETDKEIIVIRPDGSRSIVKIYPQLITDDEGKTIGAYNMLVDITSIRSSQMQLEETQKELYNLNIVLEEKVQERTRQLEEKNHALKESEERYHKMINVVNEYAIFLLDPDGYVQSWNVGAKRLKGYQEDEIIGKHFKKFYLPEDIKDGLPGKLLEKAKQEGTAIHEGWRVRKDGTSFWGNVVITAIYDEEKQLIGFSKVTRDLTESKIANDQVKQYARKLEFQNKELEQVSYVASHDLKEPLRKIQFYNSYIQNNFANTLDERGREYLKRSVNATIRMQKLITDILEYSRTSIGSNNFEPVDLSKIMNEIILLKEDDDEQNWQSIKIHIDKMPVVLGIPYQLFQLFDNLISNSIKYKHPERNLEINIEVKTVPNSEIPSNEGLTEKNYFEISVKDNGVGFDPVYSEKVFEIFQRLGDLKGASGSGIGLAICKKIVENHNGSIMAGGSKNGAEFKVYLPVFNKF